MSRKTVYYIFEMTILHIKNNLRFVTENHLLLLDMRTNLLSNERDRRNSLKKYITYSY